MGSTRRRTIVALLLAVAAGVVALRLPVVGAEAHFATGRGDAVALAEPGPLDLQGNIGGAPYRVMVPADWNGTLLVFAHGYRAPGPDADRTVAVVPTHADRAALLQAGYALAGTAYRSNGWALDVGPDDLAAVARVFAETIAPPTRTLAWGESMGGLVVAASIEEHPEAFDGAITLCGITAGAAGWWDTNGLALARAYDAAFGWPVDWGTVASPRSDLEFWTEVAPVVARQIENAADRPRWEFIRLVIGAPAEDFYRGGALLAMDVATTARVDLEVRAGGQPLAPPDGGYQLSDDAVSSLAAQGVSARPLLALMNAAAALSAPDTGARAWLLAHAQPTGFITRPVLALHTGADTVVPMANLAVYADRVAATGNADQLIALTVAGAGHCTFTAEQLTDAAALVDGWVASGVRPDPASLQPFAGSPAP